MRSGRFWRAIGVGVLCSLTIPAAKADLVTGYTNGSASQLLSANGGGGDVLFVDSAVLGGEIDINIASGSAAFASVLLPGAGFWNIGDTVSITGLALTLRSPTSTGTFTFDIREAAGGLGASGAGGLNSLGTATASYTNPLSTAVHYVNFDIPITFVADAKSTTIGINVQNTGNLALKAWNNNASGDRLRQYNYANGNLVGDADGQYWTISVAGTVAAIPEASSVAFFALISSGVGLATLAGRLRGKRSSRGLARGDLA